MPTPITLGYSPCPNDTFIFHALVNGLLETGGLVFKETLADVETLNLMARRAELDVTKLSAAAYGSLRDEYCLLRSGGAMGWGCGPMVVTRQRMTMDMLADKPIAVPGMGTTATLLLLLHSPHMREHLVAMPFNEIMPAVTSGKVAAGVIIHEGRFTYQSHGLHMVVDLGQWWQQTTGGPIPLGLIAARRTLGPERIGEVEALVRKSVEHAMAHPEASRQYIKQHAQELDDSVIAAHIALYVNAFSVDVADEGARALERLYHMAQLRGLMPQSDKGIFCT